MRRPGVLAPLGDWRFIAALTVLMVNDAVLKETFGNWTTGKLSDIAGLVVLPVLIATGLRVAGAGPRLAVRVASGAIGVWFAAMKLLPPAAEATESLFSLLTRSPSQIIVDPTDLLGLVGLLLAARIVVDPRPIVLSQKARIGLLMIGAFACLATSEDDSQRGDLYVQPETGQVVITETDDSYYDDSLTPEERIDAIAETELSPGFGEFATETCLDAATQTEAGCFRISDATIERQEPDGGWIVEWKIPLDSGLTPRASVAEATDILIDADGVVHVAFAELLPIERPPAGQWSRSFSTHRTIAVAMTMAAMVILSLAAAVVSRRRFRTAIVSVLLIVPMATYVNALSENAEGIGLYFGPMFFIALAVPAASVGLIALMLSSMQLDAKVLWAPAALDLVALKVAVAGSVVAALPLIAWKYWLLAPPWLPWLSSGSVVATLSFVFWSRVQLARRASEGDSNF